MKKTFIFVTFQKEGLHKYSAALDDIDLQDVHFLGLKHRHMFHFKVWIEVFSDNRCIEFILFKRWLESLYSTETLQLDDQSCEMMSDNLAEQIMQKYPGRNIRIEVSEDGENGSFTEYEKE